MNYDFHKCKRCWKIVRLYPDLNPDEVFNETFLRIYEKYRNKEIKDPVSMFFIVSRSSAEDLRRKFREKPEHFERIRIEWLDQDPNIYKKALDQFLEKNPDDPYSNVIRMYLLTPNLSQLSRETGIKKYKLKEILDNGLTRIGFEYLRLKSND